MSTDTTSLRIDSGATLLRQLALDLRWSCNHATDELWKQIDSDLWARTHNPSAVLQSVSRQRLTQMLADPGDWPARVLQFALSDRLDLQNQVEISQTDALRLCICAHPYADRGLSMRRRAFSCGDGFHRPNG